MSQPSAPSAPSEWAVKAALELLIRWPWARSHLVRPCDTERAIALALDAAREAGIAEGRRLERANGEAVWSLLDDVMNVLRWSTERDNIVDSVYEPLVERTCNGVGYGALMDSAQRCWRRYLVQRGEPAGGEHVSGPCRATVDAWLRAYEALPGEKPAKRGHGARGVVMQIERGDHVAPKEVK